MIICSAAFQQNYHRRFGTCLNLDSQGYREDMSPYVVYLVLFI